MAKVLMLIMSLFIGNSFALPSASELLVKLQANSALTSDARTKIVLTQQKNDQGSKTINMMWYRRDRDNSFMIVILSPESDKGNGYLRSGDNFWMYRTNTRTFQHITRDESIGGTDAKGDDFEYKNVLEKYKPAVDQSGKEIISEEMLGKVPTYKVKVVAKIVDVNYPTKIYWLQRDNVIILKEEDYSATGTLMQTVYSMKYTQVGGKYLAVKVLFIDEVEKGNKTIVDISGISTSKLDDAIFTKAYLENLSK